MPDLPPISIIATTWAPAGRVGDLRAESFHLAAASWRERMRYSGELRLHVADDGSDRPGGWPPALPGWEPTYTQQHGRGVGASLNAGFYEAFQTSPLVLYAVDDWELLEPLDLDRWAEMLLRYDDLGAIRLGLPHPDLTGKVEHRDGAFVFLPERHHFAFGLRPALFHRRMIEGYGWFDEDCSSFECERLYNERYCAAEWLPHMAVAFLHPWYHNGDDAEVGDIVPAARAG